MSLPKYSNTLLAGLKKSDRDLLAPGLEPVELKLRQSIEQAHAVIPHVYFPESGIISVVVKAAEHQIEAGLVGREGMSGTAIVLGNDRSPQEAYVQMEGAGYRISARKFRAALAASDSLRLVMQRYAHVFMVQVAHTAFANGMATIESRLARWLLMADDRHDGSELPLTHEFMAVMLGVRRSGVTDALHTLEGRRLIRASRGAIQIVNRKGLVAVAGATYGVPEAEYERLLG